MDKRTTKKSVITALFMAAAALIFVQNADCADRGVEIFTEGREFKSVKEYENYRRAMDVPYTPETSTHPELPSGSKDINNDFLRNFLDSTLKNFSDEELKALLYELKKRRGDLFGEEDPPKPQYSLEEMLAEYMRRKGENVSIDINPSKVKTITLDPAKGKSISWGNPEEIHPPQSEEKEHMITAEELRKAISEIRSRDAGTEQSGVSNSK